MLRKQPLIFSNYPQSFISSIIQPFISSIIQSFISSIIQPFISSIIQPFISSIIQPFIHSLTSQPFKAQTPSCDIESVPGVPLASNPSLSSLTELQTEDVRTEYKRRSTKVLEIIGNRKQFQSVESGTNQKEPHTSAYIPLWKI